MNGHTPTPYRLDVVHTGSSIVAGSDDEDTFRYVAQDCTDADAAFIVHACNAHDELVEALRECVEEMEGARLRLEALYESDILVERASDDLEGALFNARAALLKAKGAP